MRTPHKLAILTAALLLVLVGMTASRLDNGWLAFTHTGAFFQGDPDGAIGYDGQFFYQIALEGPDARALVDGPALRFMRVGYPLLARALVLGFPALIPLALVLVNVGAVAAGVGLLAALLQARGASPLFALMYGAWAGTLLSVRLDLAEPLCIACGLAAWLAVERGGRVLPWLIAAVLVKELGLLFALPLALDAARRRAWGRTLALGALPLLVWGAWLLVLRLWLGETPFIYPASHLEWPLAGFLAIGFEADAILSGLFVMLPAVALLTILGTDALLDRRLSRDGLLLLACTGFVMMMPRESWTDPVAALRLASFQVVAAVIYFAAWPRALPLLAAAWMPSALLALMVPGLW